MPATQEAFASQIPPRVTRASKDQPWDAIGTAHDQAGTAQERQSKAESNWQTAAETNDDDGGGGDDDDDSDPHGALATAEQAGNPKQNQTSQFQNKRRENDSQLPNKCRRTTHKWRERSYLRWKFDAPAAYDCLQFAPHPVFFNSFLHTIAVLHWLSAMSPGNSWNTFST